MPRFNFTAIDSQGRRFNETRGAADLAALESDLQNAGAWLLKAKATQNAKAASTKRSANPRAKAKRWDLINFYTLLSLLLKAGITLPVALNKLANDMAEEKLGPVAAQLARQVETGHAMSEAMTAFPRLFNRQATALVEAGEASGNLPESLEALGSNLEWIDGLVASARQALIYPLAISGASIGLVTLLFTVVVPRFQTVFAQVGSDLPAITQAILSLSDFMLGTWYYWVALAAFFPVLFTISKKIPAVALFKDRIFLAFPFFGDITRSLALSQFSSTLSMLIRSGIPLARALNLCSRQAGNSLLQNAASASEKAVIEGRPLSDELAQHKLFTQTFNTMIQTGENTGNLPMALEQLCSYYNTTVPRKIKAFFGIFEPFLIISLTAVVGVVALSLILPIMQLWDM